MRAALHVPLHVLIRPRAGDFLYDAEELLVSLTPLTASEKMAGLSCSRFVSCVTHTSCLLHLGDIS